MRGKKTPLQSSRKSRATLPSFPLKAIKWKDLINEEVLASLPVRLQESCKAVEPAKDLEELVLGGVALDLTLAIALCFNQYSFRKLEFNSSSDLIEQNESWNYLRDGFSKEVISFGFRMRASVKSKGFNDVELPNDIARELDEKGKTFSHLGQNHTKDIEQWNHTMVGVERLFDETYKACVKHQRSTGDLNETYILLNSGLRNILTTAYKQYPNTAFGINKDMQPAMNKLIRNIKG